jgi:maltose alpha-D-glucosyltransferase / alpha-amylase
LLTLGGHAFYWLSLEPTAAAEELDAAAHHQPAILEVGDLKTLLHGRDRALLDDVLPAFLSTRRWFTRKRRALASVRVEDVVDLAGLHLLFVRAQYPNDEPELLALPIAVVSDGRAVAPTSALAVVRTGGRTGGREATSSEVTLVDAGEDGPSGRQLLDAFVQRQSGHAASGLVRATTFATIEPAEAEPLSIAAAHSAAALRYGDRYFLKMFRRVESGPSPELEVARFLNDKAPSLAAPVLGALELRPSRGEPSTLAVLQAFVPNEGTAWTHARESLRRTFERVLTRQRETPPPADVPRRVLDAAARELPPALAEVLGGYADTAAMLGRRTADLHRALASETRDPAFRPEPYTVLDRRSKYQSMRNLIGRTLRLLRENVGRVPADLAERTHRLVAHPERALARVEPLLRQALTGLRIRVHGDYHLDQLLSTGKDFVIIDFEGRPDEPLAERRRKHSVMRDVAGMIRSFHYAAATALLDATVVREIDRGAVAPWAEAWHRWISGAFLRAYLEAMADSPVLPSRDELSLVLDTHILEKALLELAEELEGRSDTASIPLAALLDLVELPEPAAPAP